MKGVVFSLSLILLLSGLAVAGSSSTTRINFYVTNTSVGNNVSYNQIPSSSGSFGDYVFWGLVVLSLLIVLIAILRRLVRGKKVERKIRKKTRKSRKTRHKK